MFNKIVFKFNNFKYVKVIYVYRIQLKLYMLDC